MYLSILQLRFRKPWSLSKKTKISFVLILCCIITSGDGMFFCLQFPLRKFHFKQIAIKKKSRGKGGIFFIFILRHYFFFYLSLFNLKRLKTKQKHKRGCDDALRCSLSCPLMKITTLKNPYMYLTVIRQYRAIFSN